MRFKIKIETQSGTIREALVTSAKKIIPKRNRQRKKWMDDRWDTWHNEKKRKNNAKIWNRISDTTQRNKEQMQTG